MKLTRRHFMASTALLMATPALADTNGASDYVHQLGAEVLKLAKGGHRGDKALQKRFGALLNRYINIPSIANFALGPSKASLPPGDKAMFYDLVSNYAAALFVWYIDNFQGQDLTVNSTSQQGPFTVVESRIDGNGEPINWRVLP
jgi:ABC-type transporter MlaC component